MVRATGFTGFLYAGLMMTADGPSVLEFNVRLGDPETQPLMMRLESDWGEVLMAAARGSLNADRLEWSPEPGDLRGDGVGRISGHFPNRREDHRDRIVSADAVVFHAGTKRDGDDLVTAGGRVLGVTASRRGSARPASMRAYAAVGKIHFDGMHYRKDIGDKGLATLQ